MNKVEENSLVSTIIPVHNRPELLIEAVESVLNQSYRPIEIIIVDDGSTDDTPRIIAELTGRHPEVLSVRQENSGPGVARETGRQLVRGEYIQYLDSDDLLLPGKFQIQIQALNDNPSAGIAYGKTHHSSLGGELKSVPFKRTGEKFDYLFPALLESRWWATSTPFFRRTVTDTIGPWTDLWNEEDWEYEARAGKHHIKLAFCDEFVSVHRWHDDKLSAGGTEDSVKLAHRALAHELIYQHAVHAGITADAPDMRHFARELFLLSRQCGAAALPTESKRIFELARQASDPKQYRSLQFVMYRMGTILFGWELMGRLSKGLDRLRQ